MYTAVMDTGGLALGVVALVLVAAAWGTGIGVIAGVLVFASYYAKKRTT